MSEYGYLRWGGVFFATGIPTRWTIINNVVHNVSLFFVFVRFFINTMQQYHTNGQHKHLNIFYSKSSVTATKQIYAFCKISLCFSTKNYTY